MRHSLRSFRILSLFFAALCLGLAGCSSLQPVRSASAYDPAAAYIAPTGAPTATPAPKPTSALDVQPENCTNNLTFEQDLSIPDGTFVDPGSTLDKQWQVKNSGSCNWNAGYTVQLINGDPLGAASPQALIPSRGGSETTIRIVFTAPTEPGNYSSTWQAFAPGGQPFGDYFSIVINVANK